MPCSEISIGRAWATFIAPEGSRQEIRRSPESTRYRRLLRAYLDLNMFGLLKTAFAGLLILCTLCNQSKLTVSKNPEVPSPTPVLLERGMCRNGAELVKRLRRA